MKKKSLVVALALILSLLMGCGAPQEKMEAVSMRLQRSVGKVSLSDDKGAQLSLLEQMRLNVGNVLATEKESLAQVSLDDTRLVTMEEKTKASIDSAGKNMTINLKEGSAFFNISEKVKEGDTLKIRVGNIVCGITGTSLQGGVGPDGQETIMVTDGNVEYTETDGQTGKEVKKSLPAGKMIKANVEGNGSVSYKEEIFSEEDLSPTSLYAIEQDTSLKEKVTESSGLSGEKLKMLAEVTSVKKNASEEPVPLTGTSATLITSAVKEAFKTAGNDLNLEKAIITGVRGSLDAGLKAGYNEDALTKVTNATSEILNNLAVTGLGKNISSNDLVAVVGSASETSTNSLATLSQAGMASTEVNSVVGAIGKAYDNVIASATGNNVNVSMLSAATAGQISQVINSQVARNANGSQAAQALTGNIGAISATNTPAAQTAPAPQQEVAATPQPEPVEVTPEPVIEDDFDDDDDDEDHTWYVITTPSSTAPSSSAEPQYTGDILPETISNELLDRNLTGEQALGGSSNAGIYTAIAASFNENVVLDAYSRLKEQTSGKVGGKYLCMVQIIADDASDANPIEINYIDNNIRSTDHFIIRYYHSGVWNDVSSQVKSVQNGQFTFEIKNAGLYFFVKKLS